jgi:hypothetical protein
MSSEDIDRSGIPTTNQVDSEQQHARRMTCPSSALPVKKGALARCRRKRSTMQSGRFPQGGKFILLLDRFLLASDQEVFKSRSVLFHVDIPRAADK